MARVFRLGGLIAAYAWDMDGGGFPYAALHAKMRALGMTVPMPLSPEASRMDALRELWTTAGLEAVETADHRTADLADFDDYWSTVHMGLSVGARSRRWHRPRVRI
jgi:hypothetical protein